MTSPFEVFRQWWDYYRERQFWRLFRIFVARIFRGGGDSDSEGLDLGVGLVLTLLALPGGFVSVLMFVKYSTLLSWMRGARNINPAAVAMPDEYFFIILSVTVAGAAATLFGKVTPSVPKSQNTCVATLCARTEPVTSTLVVVS